MCCFDRLNPQPKPEVQHVKLASRKPPFELVTAKNPLPCVTVSNEVVSMAALAAGLASKALTAQSPLANRGWFFFPKYESKVLRSDPL